MPRKRCGKAGGALIDSFAIHVMMLIAPCICQFPPVDNNSVPAHKSLAPDYHEWIYGGPETLARLQKQVFR